MDLCKIIPLYPKGSGFNIISTVLFNEGNKSYKDFQKYLNGVENWLALIEDQLPNFHLRVYFDNSIKNDKKIIRHLFSLNRKHNKLQLVYYDCPKFKKDKDHHFFLFGTLIRLLPYFDYSDNDTNYVCLKDLDVSKYSDQKIITLPEIHQKQSVLIHNWGYQPIHQKYIKNKWNTFFMMISLQTSIKLPIKIFTDYLQNLLSKNSIDQEIFNKASKNSFKQINNKNPNFFYGIDEIFFNTKIIDHLYQHKNQFKIINVSESIPYIRNSIHKSLKYAGIIDLSKKVLKCKTIDDLKQFIKDHPDQIKDKYKLKIQKYNPDQVISNYYI
jgi:hypothetical protein